MLVIRLQRGGRKKSPFYHVVVAEKSAPIKGRVVERLGFYNPLVQPWSFEVDLDKAVKWIKQGAQPTNTVARLMKSAGVSADANIDKFIKEMPDRKKKKESDEPEEAPQPAKESTPAESTPAPEAPADEPASTPEAEEPKDSTEEKNEE